MQTLFNLICVLLFNVTGHLCHLTLSPTGPVSVKALVGTDVTLEVSHFGAAQPDVMWFKGDLLVAKWIVGDASLSGVASDVLKPEVDGSLTFRNVTVSCNGTYTVEMTEIGEAKVSVTFDLFIYDLITNVSLHTGSDDAVEGENEFTLYYSTERGEAKDVQWLFNGFLLKNGPHYSIGEKTLTINQPSRRDTGQYTVSLTNPFSSGTHDMNIMVLYGPDTPVLKVSPTKELFVSGESVFLSCGAEGEPTPSAGWFFNGGFISTSSGGTVNITDIKTSQSGVYICRMTNSRTLATLERNVTVTVYESPAGDPLCSVQAVSGGAALQFLCLWPGGAPEARLSFSSLSSNVSGYGSHRLTVRDVQRLNGQEIICRAEHPLIQKQCSVVPRGPVDFQPVVLTSLSPDEQMTVVIRCSPEATPEALVLWMRDGERLEDGMKYQISANISQLLISDFNASSADLNTYSCTAVNPLGNTTADTTLIRPQISNSSIYLSDDRTVVTLTWDVPLTSVITGFEIQMKGPVFSSSSQPGANSTDFRMIQMISAPARNTSVSGLDPQATYYFRVIPKAGRSVGKQSEQHCIGPADGLSIPTIAALAASIPCALLLLLIAIGFIYCGTRRGDRSPRYPVSKAVGKVVTSQSSLNPHNLLKGRMKRPPDYRQQHGLETSVDSSVRKATTV